MLCLGVKEKKRIQKNFSVTKQRYVSGCVLLKLSILVLSSVLSDLCAQI